MQSRVPFGQEGGRKRRPTRGNGCLICCGALMRVILVTFTGAAVFIVLPSWMFFWKEKDWTYIEALYFSFVTLSTIGFGDYIAGRNPDIEGLDLYRMFMVVWIFFGLAWLSSVIGLIQASITTYSTIAVQRAIKSSSDDQRIFKGEDDIEVQTEDFAPPRRHSIKRRPRKKPRQQFREEERFLRYDEEDESSEDMTLPRRYRRTMSAGRVSHRTGGGNYGYNQSLSNNNLYSVAASAATPHGDRVS